MTAAQPTIATPPAVADHAEDPVLDDWMADLITTPDGKIKACGENVYVILTRSPETKGTFRFNLVEKTIEVHGGMFAGVPLTVLDTTVAGWLQRAYGLGMGLADVSAYMLRAAYQNRYDPVANYLTSLVWDGVPRLEAFFFKYIGAKTRGADGQDLTEHLQRIGRYWFISAVARALDPGCQVDTVLVLEGKEGKGKTSALRLLGGKWFASTELVLGDKDTKLATSSSWIIELSELTSVRKSETDALKAFITTTEDRFRVPYGRVVESFKRRCVFVGTTNDAEYLTAGHGRRRFWPVHVESVDLEAIGYARDQLWAEAVHRFRAGERWYLTESEQEIANEQAEERVSETAIESKIREWWYGMDPAKRPKFVSMLEIVEDVLKISVNLVSRGVSTEIGQAMQRLKFTRDRVTVDGKQVRVYVPTQEMLEARRTGHSAHVNQVPGTVAGTGGCG